MSPWLVTILVTFAGSAFTWAGVRWGKKGDRENALIDQLQEDRDKDRERLDRLESELAKLRRDVVEQRGLLQQWEWHGSRLEDQIIKLGQTPPVRPLGIRRPLEVPGD